MIVQHSEGLIDSLAGVIAGMIENKRKRKAAMRAAPSMPSPKDTMQTSFPLPGPANDNSPMQIGKMSKAEARKDLARLIRITRAIPSQDRLAMRWGRPKGTTSKWLKQFEAEGLIQRKRADKRKEVMAH